MKTLSGLWEHRWNCIECDKSWFLSVDLSKDRDRQRLDTFYSAITKHCIALKHEVVHKEKQFTFSQRF